MEPGEEGTFSEKIHSYGNGGLEKILRKYLDLKDAEYPDYAVNAVMEQVWDAQRKETEGVCLLGTISNSDTSFEMNSGYEVDGISQFYMPVDISWQEEEGTIFCPNAEVLASVESGSATAGTNLMYGQDAVLNYDLSGLGEITEIKFFKPEYDDPKYFEPFRGQVAFYCWSSGEYETISKWEKLFDGTELEKYLSAEGTLRVRYQVADDMDVTNKNCTLPCLQITGKVVNPDAKIESLTRRYPHVTALDGLNMEIGHGQLYGFVGPNGAGKTTTIRIISGLLRPTSGKVWIDGIRAEKETRVLKSKIGYVPDFFGVYDNLTVMEYLEFYSAAYGIDEKEGRLRASEVLERVQLFHIEERYGEMNYPEECSKDSVLPVP